MKIGQCDHKLGDRMRADIVIPYSDLFV